MINNLRATQILKHVHNKKNSYWVKKQQSESIRIFKEAASGVPAYKKFLQGYGIKPETIKSWSDFQKLPYMNKSNYLKLNQLNDLCLNGKLNTPNIFTSTSGSTGSPFYFMRKPEVDFRCSVFMEDFVKPDTNKTTLVIVCFGMGVWIGGMITYKAFELLSTRNNSPISIITPGINKEAILKILIDIAPYYDEVILAGYPPFIKDVIDATILQKIKLPKLRIKFAAEAISEEFRDYIFKKAPIKNLYLDMVNVYGSADIGAMAVENATCVLIKRLLRKNKKNYNTVFTANNKIPTLAQYNPLFVNFEAIDQNIYLTSSNTLPLVRYAIGDKGGVYSFDEMDKKLKDIGIDLKSEAKKLQLEEHISELPFVYVYERDDLSTTLYGLWIYPEWIRGALLTEEIQKVITGKFNMSTKYDDKQNQILELNLELKPGKRVTNIFKKKLLKKIVKSLATNSSEYTELINYLKKKAYPTLKFFRYEDTNYFKPGVKQKWVIKIT